MLLSAFPLSQPSRPKILNNTLPKISLRSLPGVGHQVGFNTQLLVESTRYGVSIMGTARGGGSPALWNADGQQIS